MQTIVIQIFYTVYDNKIMRKGEFRVNSRLYQQYPDLEAAKVANKWFRDIQKEHGFAAEIIKVVYEGKDITHLIADNKTDESELPF